MSLPKSPSFDLGGRRALVTGASRGIGLAAATALARAGADTTLVARSEDAVEEAAGMIRGEGLKARGVALDVTDTAALEEWFGGEEPFEALVNNAGTTRPNAVVDTPNEDFDAVMELNVRAAWIVARLCAAALIKAGRPGSIINMSSQMGHVSWHERALYSASKHAMEGFTKGMAVDWGRHGIRVNTLCPTFILTELSGAMLSDEGFRSKVLDKIALGRLGTVEDLMGPILFLASDASALVTGTALMVDGGWTAA